MKKRLRISFNGKTYDVVAEMLDDDEHARPASPAPPLVGAATVAAQSPAAATITTARAEPVGSGDGSLPSPLAGKVVSIEAKVGTRVRREQPVVTLEAMKMNTTVASQTDGTVVAVHVNVGDSVEEGQVLLTIR